MEELKINKISDKTIKILPKDNVLFSKFYKKNKFFIEKIVLKYVRRDHNSFYDLCQIGAMAFIRACENFDSTRATFSTFAWQVIKNDVLQEIKRQNKIVKAEISLEEPIFQEIVQSGGSPNDQRREYSERKFLASKSFGWIHNFEDTIIKKVDIERKLNILSDTERQIYNYRVIHKMKLHQISKKMKINWHTFKVIYYNLRDKIKEK